MAKSTEARDEGAIYTEEFVPAPTAWFAAVAAVATTYVYFLIFAQFGFLKRVQEVVGESGGLLKPIMGTMALAGLAGCAVGTWRWVDNRAVRRLVVWFAVCGAAAGLSIVAKTPALLFAIAALTGLGTGALTVTLAAALRRVTGGEKLGSAIGLGTGLAYGFCNLPPVFSGSATAQAALGLAAACVGLLAVQALELRAPRQVANGFDYQPVGIGAWVVVFLALVWLDSGAFYVIQHSPNLQQLTWGNGRLFANAALHLVAAVLAGYMMDRRWVGRSVFGAAAALGLACLLIVTNREKIAEGALLYTAAVSVYSVALVFYPARSGRVWLAALVYGVAGWIGSASGIAMMEGRHAIPRWFVAAAGAVIALGLAVRGWTRRRELRRVGLA